jgi:hypothetical protein
MKYYFKVTDNVIDSSYAYDENEIKLLFPDLDLTTNVPEGYIKYIPYASVTGLKPYEKFNLLGYDYIDDVTVTDVVEIVPMTLEEKIQKQESVKTEFYNRTKRYTWILNEEHCIMLPPFMPPNDEWLYRWDENTQSYINTNITKLDHQNQNRNRYASN